MRDFQCINEDACVISHLSCYIEDTFSRYVGK